MGSAYPHSAQNRRSELFSVLQLAQRILEPSQGDSYPQAKVCYGSSAPNSWPILRLEF
jgi:hypothetical protein